MILRLGLRLLFSSKNIYAFLVKVKLCYSHVLAGICSPISTGLLPCRGLLCSLVPQGYSSAKLNERDLQPPDGRKQ